MVFTQLSVVGPELANVQWGCRFSNLQATVKVKRARSQKSINACSFCFYFLLHYYPVQHPLHCLVGDDVILKILNSNKLPVMAVFSGFLCVSISRPSANMGCSSWFHWSLSCFHSIWHQLPAIFLYTCSLVYLIRFTHVYSIFFLLKNDIL